MRRQRRAKIIATLGPATSSAESIHTLFLAGADVFRLNFSHGTQEDHRERIGIIRDVEQSTGRPIAALLDLQGPKLRVGRMHGGGPAMLEPGKRLRLDLDPEPGTAKRAPLPHPEVFAALMPGTQLLIDDGRIRLEVVSHGEDHAECIVRTGGALTDHKGVNVPDVVLPVSPFTDKDRDDLAYGLELGVDWVAASFVQRPEDVRSLREQVAGRALVMTKLEKPAAIEHLEEIVALSDGVMVARGDLGVELPPEDVPAVQRRIVRECRTAGRPVVVATQMLESMVSAPVPTRAEASDVAGAIYDGADAVMLSAETAVGKYPREAVEIMNRIICKVEDDPIYHSGVKASLPPPQPTTADAISDALRHVTDALPIAATVTYTSSGFSSLRAARERPDAPILSLTPSLATARRLALVWGVHSVHGEGVQHVQEMVDVASRVALEEGFAQQGERLAIVAGMPFGVSGTTNMLRIAKVDEMPEG